MSILDRHLDFVHALRRTGMAVSLAEALDAVHAIELTGIADRERLRATYAATLVKRQSHRSAFDEIFDLYFPARVGAGSALDTQGLTQSLAEGLTEGQVGDGAKDLSAAGLLADGPEQLAAFQEQLVTALGRRGAWPGLCRALYRRKKPGAA